MGVSVLAGFGAFLSHAETCSGGSYSPLKARATQGFP
jgi:hypothetical protein